MLKRRTRDWQRTARWIGAPLLSLLVLAMPARAAPARRRAAPGRDVGRACVAAYNGAVSLEAAGHLREAQPLWAACARPTCSAFLQRECGTRYTRLDEDIPTVVPMAVDENGQSRTDVKVAIDGEVVSTHLDGRALAVDPGVHEFTFTSEQGVHVGKILIGQGQRNRAISAVLRSEAQARGDEPLAVRKPPPVVLARVSAEQTSAVAAAVTTSAPARTDEEPDHKETTPKGARAASVDRSVDLTEKEPPQRRISPVSLALAGTGVVGLSGFGLLTYWGRKDNNALGVCSPHCPTSSVDHVHRVYLAADVSLGVGIAALAGAYWVYAATRSSKEEEANRQSYLFDVEASRAGAMARLSGSF